MASLMLLHGPNLNLLGQREPEFYGQMTLDDINQQATSVAEVDTALSNFQAAVDAL
mgnify:CR=1 FL=1